MATLDEHPRARTKKGKHRYSMWQTLFEIDDKYVPIKPIGKGSYGVVCSSINRETNEKVAIKKIADVFGNSIDALRALREVTILRQLRHVNVIILKDVMVPTKKASFKDLYLVYELMDTDLHQIIKSKQPLSGDHIKCFVFQLLCGLKYLHTANVLHRDLKPTNLFVNANCDLKIGDFGLARTTARGMDEYMTEYVVSRWYRAPELLVGSANYGTSVDIWSAGCIFAEILGGTPIFPGKDYLHQLSLVASILGTRKTADYRFIESPNARKFMNSLPFSNGIPLSQLYPTADPLAVDLLEKMLSFDPSKRITVHEALEHPYMEDLYNPIINCSAQFPVHLDLDDLMDEHELRKTMLEEMLYFHPELARTGRR